jgi:hypothetical protein
MLAFFSHTAPVPTIGMGIGEKHQPHDSEYSPEYGNSSSAKPFPTHKVTIILLKQRRRIGQMWDGLREDRPRQSPAFSIDVAGARCVATGSNRRYDTQVGIQLAQAREAADIAHLRQKSQRKKGSPLAYSDGLNCLQGKYIIFRGVEDLFYHILQCDDLLNHCSTSKVYNFLVYHELTLQDFFDLSQLMMVRYKK